MVNVFGMSEPLLANSIGHSVGVLLFATFLAVVLRERRHNWLAVTAAVLALLWNMGSLAVLAASTGLIPRLDLASAFSFSVLSLLPAVLLHLCLEEKFRPVWIIGYALSGVAMGLHLAEVGYSDPRFHQAGLWVTTIGFVVLTGIVTILGGLRMTATVCLLLLAISFLHFGSGNPHSWAGEWTFHHAGIPLALGILLQDYRFVLLDAFVRFMVNSLAVAGFIAAGLSLNARFGLLELSRRNAVIEGMILVTIGFLLIAQSSLR